MTSEKRGYTTAVGLAEEGIREGGGEVKG